MSDWGPPRRLEHPRQPPGPRPPLDPRLPRAAAAPAPGPAGGPAGLPRAALVLGAVVGLVVGAVGFVALAPAEGTTAGPDGTTVTTSPGAGGTEGEAAAEGQAAT